MKITDLRIGNLIQWGDESNNIVSIVGLYLGDNEYPAIETNKKELATIDEFVGVKLTDEWYKKLGFHFYQGVWYDKTLSNMIFPDGRFFSVGEVGGEWYINTVHFVHELQNLYFAVEGEELIIKK
jgi:hypothetical protein